MPSVTAVSTSASVQSGRIPMHTKASCDRQMNAGAKVCSRLRPCRRRQSATLRTWRVTLDAWQAQVVDDKRQIVASREFQTDGGDLTLQILAGSGDSASFAYQFLNEDGDVTASLDVYGADCCKHCSSALRPLATTYNALSLRPRLLIWESRRS
ncbi:MAG: hypothetical protein R2692_05975 [Microbacterium sp.]